MDIKSKINKVTCTFLDPELENEYKKSEWVRENQNCIYNDSPYIFSYDRTNS